MRPGLLKATTGTAAVEFALIVPVLCLMAMGALALGFGFWTVNALESVSQEVARCVAIDSSVCTEAAPGCAAPPEICFAVGLSERRGLAGVEDGDVTIERSRAVGGVDYAVVSIRLDLTLLGYGFDLTAENRVPRTD